MSQASSGLPRTLWRARNLAVRTLHGLPSSAQAVSPQIDNDSFQAHLATYRFAAGMAEGRRCLDLGCGTGYGAAELLAGGGRQVVGLDADPKAVRYAGKRFAGDHASFQVADVSGPGETLSPDQLGRFGLIAALGLLVHLEDPAQVVSAAARLMEPDGVFVASLPPILDGQAMEAHRTASGHRSNLYLWDWEDLLSAQFGSLRLFRQRPAAGPQPDFSDPGPSRVTADTYRIEEIPLADLYDVGTLAAIYVGTEPRGDG